MVSTLGGNPSRHGSIPPLPLWDSSLSKTAPQGCQCRCKPYLSLCGCSVMVAHQPVVLGVWIQLPPVTIESPVRRGRRESNTDEEREVRTMGTVKKKKIDMEKVVERVEKETRDLVSILESILKPFNKKVCSKCGSGCCCSGCGGKYTRGYLLKGYYKDERHLYKDYCAYVRYLEDKYGFRENSGPSHKLDGYFRKGKGCRLPRYLRSKTCLYHLCTPKAYEYFDGIGRVEIRLGGVVVEVSGVEIVRAIVDEMGRRRQDALKSCEIKVVRRGRGAW